jgi:spore coat polysaccharide biosynthesis predicted glycosyltransferase SpsG
MHLSNIKIIIIIGPFFKDVYVINDLVKNKKNIIIKYSSENIWNEFRKADVVISKSGITLYELAIMGIPALCISSFKHEEPSAKKFMTKKVLINLGMQKTVTKNQIEKQLVGLLDNIKKRKIMSSQGKKTVDGKGLSRVTKIIESFLLTSSF